MERKRSLTAILAIVLALPLARSFAAESEIGKTAYEKNCAGCHGKDGKGNSALAKTLGEKGLNIVTKATKQKSDDELLKIIIEGAGKMPPSKKLNADEQKAVLRYARSLAK